MLDKVIGGLSEATGSAAGDKSLEAEGRALRPKGEMKTYLARPHAEEKKGWKLRGPGEPQACTGRNPSDGGSEEVGEEPSAELSPGL